MDLGDGHGLGQRQSEWRWSVRLYYVIHSQTNRPRDVLVIELARLARVALKKWTHLTCLIPIIPRVHLTDVSEH